jgi:hypothetical protein
VISPIRTYNWDITFHHPNFDSVFSFLVGNLSNWAHLGTSNCSQRAIFRLPFGLFTSKL